MYSSGPLILITGSSDGIGLETARQLARHGADVILHGRRPDRVLAARQAVESLCGRAMPEPIVADLSSLSSASGMAFELARREVFPEVLINNAGVFAKQLELFGQPALLAEPGDTDGVEGVKRGCIPDRTGRSFGGGLQFVHRHCCFDGARLSANGVSATQKKTWGRAKPFPTRVLHWPARTGLEAYAARAALAFVASTSNALMSCTAMSASALRSRVMPAFSMPFMKRL